MKYIRRNKCKIYSQSLLGLCMLKREKTTDELESDGKLCNKWITLQTIQSELCSPSSDWFKSILSLLLQDLIELVWHQKWFSTRAFSAETKGKTVLSFQLLTHKWETNWIVAHHLFSVPLSLPLSLLQVPHHMSMTEHTEYFHRFYSQWKENISFVPVQHPLKAASLRSKQGKIPKTVWEIVNTSWNLSMEWQIWML